MQERSTRIDTLRPLPVHETTSYFSVLVGVINVRGRKEEPNHCLHVHLSSCHHVTLKRNSILPSPDNFLQRLGQVFPAHSKWRHHANLGKGCKEWREGCGLHRSKCPSRKECALSVGLATGFRPSTSTSSAVGTRREHPPYSCANLPHGT